jgi:colanic acid biosynthesis glycosyl transferase WcaI
MTEIAARLLTDDDGCPAGVSEEQESVAVTALPKKKRVLIYGINYTPEPIGVGRYTGELGAYLSRQGAEVEVITAAPHYPGWTLREGYPNSYNTECIANVHLTRCPLLLRAGARGIWRILAPLSFAVSSAPVAMWRILTFRPDTILCVEPTLFIAPIAALLGRLIGARTVLHVQDLEVDAAFAVGHISGIWLQKAAFWFERKTLSSFGAVITISNAMRDHLLKKGVRKSRLIVVRNWVDLDAIKPLEGSSSFRRELGISSEKFVALYSGNIGPKQALPLLLDAAASLAGHQELFFVIAGDGPEKKRLIKEYDHLTNVKFIPLQPEERLCELLNLADVHILPQHAGTADLLLPSKLGGMLASGKRCIVMADAGTELHNILTEGVILTEAGNSKALAQGILRSAEDEDTGVEARLQLAMEFDSNKNLSALEQVLIGHPVLMPQPNI